MMSLTSVRFVIVAAALSGCASAPINHLNDPARSHMFTDVANILKPREIPYETQEKGGLAVNYSLSFFGGEDFSGYRLTLIFRSNREYPSYIEPRVHLRDAAGFIIQPATYSAFVAYAAAMAGTNVPPMPTASGERYYHSGTITSTTGSQLRYSGYTSSVPSGGFAGGFADGLTQGAAIAAANNRRNGINMLLWANQYWLKEAYGLLSGTAVSGALFFPANSVGKLPLSLSIDAGDEHFEFKTIAATK